MGISCGRPGEEISTADTRMAADRCRLALDLPDVSAAVTRAYLNEAKVREIAVIAGDGDLRMVILRRLRRLRASKDYGRRDPALTARIVLVAAALGLIARP